MRILRASVVSLLLLCILTGAANAQTCTPLQGVQTTLEGAQNFCRTSTGGTLTAAENGGGTSTHQWVYGASSNGPWTPIAGATGATYQLNGSDFPSSGTWWIAVTSTPQCGAPMTSGAQTVTVNDTLPPPDFDGNNQICSNATSAIAQSAAPWDSYSWSITHATLIPGANGCGDDPGKRCISYRPDGTGEVHLSLTVTAGSCSSNALRAVPLVENPPPSLSVQSPLCAGSEGSAITSQFPAGVRAWSVRNARIDSDFGDHIFFTPDGNGPVDVTLTVTDTNGCASTNMVRVPLAATKPAIMLGAPGCANQTTAAATGGWDSYEWSITNGTITSGQGTPNISFSGTPGVSMILTVTGRVSSGTFSCTTTSDPLTVPSVTTPTITLGTADICQYGTDTATAAAGYATYSWSVSNGYVISGDGTNSITFARGGYPNDPNDPITVRLIVADANGCSSPQVTAMVPTRTIPAPAITLATPDICRYGTDTASVPPGYANYYWSITNGYIYSGDGTNSITFAPGGTPGNSTDPITITLFVGDPNGCPAPQASVTVPIRTIPAPTISLATPDICRYGTDTASVPPGYANYYWSITNGYIYSGDRTNSITFAPGGTPGNSTDPITITLNVTDANGCPAPQASVTVPIRTIPAPTISLATPDICRYGTNTASVAPGYANYYWSITNGYIYSGDGTNSITFAPGGGMPGDSTNPITITLYVTDANGCPAPQASVTVAIRTIAVPPITLATPDICRNGTNTASVPPGYANYSWSITGGTITGGTQYSNSITFTPDAVSNDPITLSLYVQDGNGCPAKTGDIVVPIRTIPPPQITLGSATVCPGATGTASVPASYVSYSWSISNGVITGGSGTNAISFQADGSGNVSLSVSVADGSGCNAISASETVLLDHANAAITASGPTTFCPGGSVTLTASGGASYAWSTGATTQSIVANSGGNYSVTVTEASGCSATSTLTTVTINATPVASISAQNSVCAGSTYGAVAGTAASYQWSVANGMIVDGQGTNVIHYTSGASGNVTLTLTVANAQGCSDTQSVAVPIANVQAAITPSGPLTICPGGSVTLTASAGASYIWSNNTYAQSTTVTQAGSYWVRVFDAAGCSAQSQSVTVSVASPSATITPSGPTTFCARGSVTLSAPAGYSYSWSNGATTQSITVNQSNTYTVTVQDGNGCTASSSTAVTVNPLPQVVFTGASIVCGTSESAQEVQPLGTGLTYAWTITNGAITQNAGHRVYFTANAGATEVVLRVTISDANCSNSDSITLPVHTPPDATITTSGPTTFCSGGNVTLTAPAGMSAYSWSNGATTQSITVSTQDSYTVTVRDANLCSTQSSPVVVTVNPLPAPSISTSGVTTFCAGGNVTLTASAGYSSYLWNTGARTQSITVSTSDNYSVTVSDGSCSGTSAQTAVTVRTLPTAAVSGSATICPGGSSTITAALTGTAPWNVTWSDNVTQTINSGTTASRSVSPAATKTYSIDSIRDANCTGTSGGSATITVKTLPTATVSGGGAICPGASATITATLTGTAPFSVTWSDNVTQTINSGTSASRSVSPAATMTYTVTSVSDAASCPSAGSGSATMTVKTLPTATVSGGGAICPGASATITATLTGTAPWSVRWSDNTTQPINTGTTATRSVSPAATTTYTVTAVTDSSGCAAVAGSGSATVTRSVAASITTQPSNKSTTINTNVTISVVAAGTSPISYQWFKTNGTIVTGATSSSYTTSFPAKGNYQFYVEVWNACNTTHVKSHNVTVTVN